MRTRAEDERGDEPGDATGHVHDQSSGEVQHSHLVQPTLTGEDPPGQGIVAERGPEKDEDHVGNELHSTDHRSADQRRSDDGEGTLKGAEG